MVLWWPNRTSLYRTSLYRLQVITLLHGQRRLEGSVEVVPGIYSGGQDAAAAEVATGGMSQVRHTGARCTPCSCCVCCASLLKRGQCGVGRAAACVHVTGMS